MKKLLIVPILLIFAPNASAAVVAPFGESVSAPDGTTMVLAQTDKVEQQSYQPSNMSLPFDVANGLVKRGSIYQWGSAGCSLVGTPVAPGGDCTLIPGVKVGWRVRRFHQYRTTEAYFDALVFRFYPATADPVQPGHLPDVLTHRPQYNTPDCNASGDNDGWIVPWGPGPAGLGAGPLAPADFAQACGLPRAGETPTGETPTNETTTNAPLRRCAAFKYGRKNVAVTSRGVACTPARNMLARFVRSNVEPDGYVCVKVRLGRMVAAKCKRVADDGRARAAARPVVVEGRWRR